MWSVVGNVLSLKGEAWWELTLQLVFFLGLGNTAVASAGSRVTVNYLYVLDILWVFGFATLCSIAVVLASGDPECYVAFYVAECCFT